MQILTIEDLPGSYTGSLKKRVFNIVFGSEGNGGGIGNAATRKEVVYMGQSIIVNKIK